MLTVEQFKQVLPPNIKKSVNQELIDRINDTLNHPELFEVYKENLLSYTRVMADGKFTIPQYVSAVKYVSHKLMGDSNTDAYVKTFPDKYQGFLNKGVASKDIASYITAYNKSKLVNLIYEQTIIPDYVLNHHYRQQALNVLADLMMNARSEKVRGDTANNLLNHLKLPEVSKVELDIGIKQDSSIDALRQSTLELIEQQRQIIAAGGMTAKEVAETKVVIDMGEAIEVGVEVGGSHE